MFIFVFRLDYGILLSETTIGAGVLNPRSMDPFRTEPTVPGQLKVEHSVSALTSDPFHRLGMNEQGLVVAWRGPDIETLGMMCV